MRLKILVVSFLLVISILCFIVVYIMHSNLSFIDYPYLYTKADKTQNFLGHNYHWRKVEETLCTFLTSKKIINKYFKKFISTCEFEHYPFEKPFHDIYKKELCISPMPALAVHFTNINSIYGLSPLIDYEKLWKENKI